MTLLTYSLTHSLIHSLTYLLTHSLTYLLTHLLTQGVAISTVIRQKEVNIRASLQRLVRTGVFLVIYVTNDYIYLFPTYY